MAWPMSQDYNESIQNPRSCFEDAELRQGNPSTSVLGLPMPRSGNFADVYEFNCPATQCKWAIKCFTREISGLRERYREISAHLKQVDLPFMVDFTYLEQGIKVGGQWFPILKMRWVEGVTLNEFVKRNLDKPQLLASLAQLWVKLSQRMRAAKVAHCDLQHGNVLLVQGTRGNALGVKLIDYDGMFVPALEHSQSGEVGHPNFQHARRLQGSTYNLEVDRFPHLVIYTALRVLTSRGKPLWDKFDNGDNLLFRQPDLETPTKSPLFQDLLRIDEPATKKLVETLLAATAKPLEKTPLLNDLVTSYPVSATAVRVESFGTSHEDLPPGMPEKSAIPECLGSSLPENRLRGKTRKKPLVFATVSLVAVGLVGGIFIAHRERDLPKAPRLASIENKSEGKAHAEQSSPAAIRQAASVKPSDDPGARPRSDELPGPEPLPTLDRQPESRPEPDPKLESDPIALPELAEKAEPKQEPKPVPKQEPKPVPKPERPPSGPIKITEVRSFQVDQYLPVSLAISSDSRSFVSGGTDGVLRLWNVETGQALKTFSESSFKSPVVAFVPDGSKVIGVDKSMHVWDIETGKELFRIEDENAPLTCVAVSPDGRFALTGGEKGSVRLWDLLSRKPIRSFVGHEGAVWSVAFSSDGSRAVTGGGTDHTIRIWNVADGAKLKILHGHKGSVLAVAFSPNNREVLSGSFDRTLRLWNVASGKEIRSLFGHTSIVRSVAFTRDGEHAFSAGEDQFLRLWNLTNGKEEKRLEGERELMSVAVAPNGRFLLSAGLVDGRIRMWQLPKLELNPDDKPTPTTDVKRGKFAIPAPADQAKAEKEIRELFKADYAKRRTQDVQALARKLLREGLDSKDKQVERYVLLRESSDLAALSGDVSTSFRAIVALAEVFAIDVLEMKQMALVTATKTGSTPAGRKAIVDRWLGLVDESLDADDYEKASQFLSQAEALAKQANNIVLSNSVNARRKDVKALRQEFDAVRNALTTLKKQPNDPKANLAVGKFYCFHKGSWQAGIPLLAKGSDAALKSLAKSEASPPDAADAQAALGDLLWSLAEKEQDTAKMRMLLRAHYWYEEAALDLKGISKAKVESRLKQIDDLYPEVLNPPGQIRVIEGHTDRVNAVAFVRKTRQALSGGADKTLRLWNLETGQELHRFEGLGEVKSIASTSDGGIALVVENNQVQLFDIENRREQRNSVADQQLAAMSLDGLSIITSSDKYLYKTLTPSAAIGGDWSIITSLALSFDSRLAILGTTDGTIHVVALDTEKEIKQFPSQYGKVSGVAISPDKRVVASTHTATKLVHLWDMASGRAGKPLRGHTDRVTCVVFSRDGRRLLTASADKTIRLWDVKSGKELIRLEGHSGEVTNIAISANGRRAISASADKTVRLWGLPR